MKYLSRIVLCIVALGLTQVFAQETNKAAPAIAQPELTKFDLDFPGGTPGQLVAAIQKASGRPLNVIVDPEDANRQLPPVKMSRVTVPELFGALSNACTRYRMVGGIYTQTALGFSTPQSRVSDDSIWIFRVQEQPIQSKESRFYLLTPYLDQGLTVDDITTAIQTAWKLRGITTAPVLNYHKETKLLIAVGYSGELGTISDVLTALGRPKPKPSPDSEPKPAATDTKPKS
jgi:hypothetical protein